MEGNWLDSHDDKVNYFKWDPNRAFDSAEHPTAREKFGRYVKVEKSSWYWFDTKGQNDECIFCVQEISG